MKLFLSKLYVVTLFSFFMVACQPDQHPKITGKWSGEDGRGTKQVFDFKTDSTVLWIFNPSAEADTFALNYKINYSKSPIELDVNGFNRGFLKDKTLFGIVEFTESDTFKVDFEPGPANAISDSIRPQSFTDETVKYFRIVN